MLHNADWWAAAPVRCYTKLKVVIDFWDINANETIKCKSGELTENNDLFDPPYRIIN